MREVPKLAAADAAVVDARVHIAPQRRRPTGASHLGMEGEGKGEKGVGGRPSALGRGGDGMNRLSFPAGASARSSGSYPRPS